MGNDGGRRQWWGLTEGEGVVCWASHFVRGPSVFIRARRFVRARSSSFVRGLLCLLSGRGGRFWLVVRLVVCRGSLCPRALVVRGSAHVVVCGWRVVHGGVIVIRGGGIVVRGWGIAFRGWGSSLSVVSGARRLFWFERRGGLSRGWWAWCGGSRVWRFVCVGVRVCGGSRGWWGFAWVWAFT